MEGTSGSRAHFCPRLVDYIAIVGSRGAAAVAASNEINSIDSYASSSIQVPELLRRYPPQDHKDFPLPIDIVYFCQPEGCSFVKTKRSAVKETNTFVFTLTEKDANRVRYGVVVNFYRPVQVRRAVASLNNSSRPTPSPTTSNVNNESIGRCDSRSILRPASSVESASSSCPKRHLSNLSSLTSLCLISHHPFFPSFRECLVILKQLIDACSEKNSSLKSPTSSSHHVRR